MREENEIRWNQDLEGAALRIARTEHTPLRVIAGPGTGKTFAMMRRVARLIQDGAQAERILVATFTRMAAHDLQKELRNLEVIGANEVHAATLHSFCFGLLSSEEVLRLTGRTPRPLMAFEERFLREDIKGEPVGGLNACKERLEAFNAAWARRQSDEPGWPNNPIDQEFHVRLMRWFGRHEAMLVGELVPLTLDYLRNNPASPVFGSFHHVLVDEYQDLNRAEQKLLDLLAENSTLTVVGDEDQSIYSFRYAHPEGISRFDEGHADTIDENLVECRRCPRLVVRLANAFIAHNTDREQRSLTESPRNLDGDVEVIQWNTMEDEANGLAELIAGRITAGAIEPGEILVLSPSRRIGYAIRDALLDRGVISLSFFHEQALDGNPCVAGRHDAQKAFTLLTLVDNPNDRVALRSWCGFGSPSLLSGAWSRLMDHCDQTGTSPADALHQMTSGGLVLPHSGGVVARFRQLQASLVEYQPMRGRELLDALFPEAEEWTTFMRAVANPIADEDYDARRLKEVLRTAITQPELPTEVEYVRVMSLHKSKGLTARFVVVAGCVRNLIPRIKGETREDQERSLQEQRRLFYVALTRTTQTLILSSFIYLPTATAHLLGVPAHAGQDLTRVGATLFMQELGPELPRATRTR